MQLDTIGLGESQPLDTNDTKQGRKRNRRVELLTLSNIDSRYLQDSEPMLGAANSSPEPSEPVMPQPSETRVAAASLKRPFKEPVFPSMSGVKIEPLPRSEYVAGLSLGGILRDVDFVDDSATLTDASSAQLRVVSQKLENFPAVRLVVMGHTDNKLSPDESNALSLERALSVVKFLTTEGVDASRLSAEGFGSSLPLAQNVTAADRRRNHRIELRVVN